MEYRAGIFCGEVEVVLSNSNYGIEFLKLFEHDGIHEIVREYQEGICNFLIE